MSNIIETTENSPFPRFLAQGKYSLVREVKNNHFKYRIAEYSDEGNAMYIAKLCAKKAPLEKQRQFKNENIAYNIFAKCNIPLNISIPKYLGRFDDVNSSIFLMSKLPGEPLKINSEESATNIIKVVETLSDIYHNTSILDKDKLPTKSKWSFILFTPLLSIKSLLNRKVESTYILKTTLEMIRRIPSVLNNSEYSFVHKDLNPHNILVDEGKIGLVDFQLLRVSLQSHDFGNAIYSNWELENSEYLETVIKKYINMHKNRDEVVFMLLYAALFDLAFGKVLKRDKLIRFINTILGTFKTSPDKSNTIGFISYDDIKNPIYGGGGAKSIHEVAKRLSHHYSVVVYSWNHSGIKNENIDGVLYTRVGSNHFGPKIAMLIFQIFIPFKLLFKKHTVLLENFGPPFTSSILPILINNSAIGITHSLPALEMQRKYKVPMKEIENYLIRKYKYIIATTSTIKNKIGGINPDCRIEIIPNGIHLSPQVPQYNPKANDLLFVGRIEIEQKGIDLLLQAYRLYCEVHPESKLYIVGSGSASELKRLSDLISRIKLSNNVITTGKLNEAEINEIARSSFCSVVTSRVEGFCMVALESLARGMPVVAFDIEGLKWLSEEQSIKVNPFSIESFANALLQLKENPDYCFELSKRGRELVGEYTWEDISVRYEKFIEEVSRNEK